MTEREILHSWKEISDYLKRDVRTCHRYERVLGLPVRRLEGSPRARVFAFKDELDAWRAKRPQERPGFILRLLDVVKSKPLAAGLAIILLLGSAALVLFLLPDLIGFGGGPELAIAVLPFHNDSRQADLDKWTQGIPNLLIQGLSGSRYFSVLGDDRTTGVLLELGKDPAAPYSSEEFQKIKKKSGATHAVTGRVFEAGEGLVVTITTARIGGDEVYSSRFECDDEASVIKATIRMADQIKRDLGLTRTIQSGDFDATGVPITTSSLEAFRIYNEARRLHVAGRYAASSRLMRKALRLDPEFALAWRSLAASLGGEGNDTEAEVCIRKAVEFSRNASTQERFFINAAYFHHRSEFNRALQVFREWSSLYPDDTQAMLFAGRAYLFEEDTENARRVLSEGLRKGDRNPFMFLYASLSCTAAGLFEEAARVREKGLSIHPRSRLITGSGVTDAIVQGSYDRALSELEAMRGEDPALSLDLKSGDVLLLKGNFRGAERSYANTRPLTNHNKARLVLLALAEGRYGRAVELAAEAGDDLVLAYARMRAGRSAEGLEAASRALRTAEVRGHCLTELVALQYKGILEALSGNLDQAKATQSRFKEHGQRGLTRAHDRASACLRGFIASAEGRHTEAVEEFERATMMLPLDMPYLDDQPYAIGIMAGMQAMTLYAAAQEHERAGDPGAAAGLYRRLLELRAGRLQHPDLYALSHHALGKIRQSLGDAAGAREYYSMFLEIWQNADPDIPEVEDAKASLAAIDR